MIRSSTFTALALGLGAATFASGVFAQAAPDPAKGRDKSRMCAGCHGIDGWRTAFPEVYTVPRIGGQHPAYIIKSLQDYKNGDRQHPSMRAIAASLTDEDMADLAAYYGQQPIRTAGK